MAYEVGDKVWYNYNDTQYYGVIEEEDSEAGTIQPKLYKKPNGNGFAYGTGYHLPKYGIKLLDGDRWTTDTVSITDIIGVGNESLFDSYISSGPHEFFGVDGTAFRLGTQMFQAIEDPSDGYRSYLRTITTAPNGQIFFRDSIAYVNVISITEDNAGDYGNAFEGYALVDAADGHAWLIVGTDNSDDYYPTFIFDYEPKAPEE